MTITCPCSQQILFSINKTLQFVFVIYFAWYYCNFITVTHFNKGRAARCSFHLFMYPLTVFGHAACKMRAGFRKLENCTLTRSAKNPAWSDCTRVAEHCPWRLTQLFFETFRQRKENPVSVIGLIRKFYLYKFSY